ncbi:MAG TPA: P-loop NTPase fold protein [Chloroflexota bacterium]|nr:P-loop NTPase fold protein [Chloroflexota bacterium]
MSTAAAEDDVFKVVIAWPIWAGGYPTIEEALAAVTAHHAELETSMSDEVGRILMTIQSAQRPFGAGKYSELSFGAGDYQPVSGLNPGPRQSPNSLLGTVQIRHHRPLDALTTRRIVVAIRSTTEAFAHRRMPGASAGANQYEVTVTGGLLPSIEDVVRAAGGTVDVRVGEFARVAGSLQQQRFQDGVSNTELLTRSTALLALIRFDAGIRDGLELAGLREEDLRTVLSAATPDSTSAINNPGPIHPDFVDALGSYLDRHGERRAINLADIAVAIVDAGKRTTTGLLHQRLSELNFDYGLARETLISLLNTGSAALTVVALAREVASRGSRVDGLREALSAVPAEGPPVDRSVLQASVDRLFGGPTSDGDRIIAGLGAINSSLRRSLDEAGVWLRLLVSLDLDELPPESDLRVLLQAVRFEHGYASDHAQGEDQLGIDGEVNALCDVLVNPDVVPPLAVGLFGPWGSGKSFFMERMRSRISSRTSGRPDGVRVLQIRFNAWHYADTSLWASLAVEIFERIVDPEPVDPAEYRTWLEQHGDQHRDERAELLERLETYRAARSALDAEQKQLEEDRKKLESARSKAACAREVIVAGAKLTDVAGALMADPEVRQHIQALAERLGFQPVVEELPMLTTQLRTTGGYVTAVWRETGRPRLVVSLMGAFVVLTAAATALLIKGVSWTEVSSVASIITVVTAISGVVALLARLVTIGASGVNKLLGLVETAIATAARREAMLRTQRTREEKRLEIRLIAKDEEIARTTTAIAGLDERIAATAAAATSLSVGRKLYDFLVDRAAGYQRHQGIVGMLYRDFRILDQRLRAYRTAEDRDSTLMHYDRVILYVDDLDRCPPAKVLEVLQAVHLLLALPLFVVVVGVDPRWLKRSLRHTYRQILGARDDTDLESMPIEYLEKIFQIPFSVPSMQESGFADLIASLAPNLESAAIKRATSETPSSTTSVGSTTLRSPTRGLLNVEAGSAASTPTQHEDREGGDVLGVQLDGSDGATVRSIDLTPAEVSFAALLGPLVATPRAAKRLMNTYRLLRSTQYVTAGSRLLGTPDNPGQHQAVLTLLAVAAGHPTEADRVLIELEESSAQSWPDFVDVLDTLKPSLRVTPCLRRTLGITTLNDLEPYRKWGPVVARFTFTL